MEERDLTADNYLEPEFSQEDFDSGLDTVQYSNPQEFIQHFNFGSENSTLTNLYKSAEVWGQKHFTNSPVLNDSQIQKLNDEYKGIDIPKGTKKVVSDSLVNDFVEKERLNFIEEHAKPGWMSKISQLSGTLSGSFTDVSGFLAAAAVPEMLGLGGSALAASLAGKRALEIATQSAKFTAFMLPQKVSEAVLQETRNQEIKLNLAEDLLGAAVAGGVLEGAVSPLFKALYGKFIKQSSKAAENITEGEIRRDENLTPEADDIEKAHFREEDLATNEAEVPQSTVDSSSETEFVKGKVRLKKKSFEEFMDRFEMFTNEQESDMKVTAINQMQKGQDVDIDFLAKDSLSKQVKKLREDLGKTGIDIEEFKEDINKNLKEFDEKTNKNVEQLEEINKKLKESPENEDLLSQKEVKEKELQTNEQLKNLHDAYRSVLEDDFEDITPTDAAEFYRNLFTSEGDFKNTRGMIEEFQDLEEVGDEDITPDSLLKDKDESIINEMKKDEKFRDIIEEEEESFKKETRRSKELPKILKTIVSCLTLGVV